jgi:hypothetical protein
MRRSSASQESGGFEMKREPRYRLTSHWGHWSGPDFDDDNYLRRRRWKRFVDSFRRDPRLAMNSQGVDGANGRVFDPANAAAATANAPLARRLKGRHLQMIAIGGSIGT